MKNSSPSSLVFPPSYNLHEQTYNQAVSIEENVEKKRSDETGSSSSANINSFYLTHSPTNGIEGQQLQDKSVASLMQTLKEKCDFLLNGRNNDNKKSREFMKGLDEISVLLNTIDPPASSFFKTVDEKAQDLSTYFLAAYADTKDAEKSMHVYKIVKSLIRYIVLMDRFYEIGNPKYKRSAQQLLRDIKREGKGHLKYTVSFALARCWPFWDFEKIMKKRLADGNVFTLKEIRYHNMFKSSDAFGIYGSVLDSELPHYTDNVGLVLHYNQAIQDAIDDFMDIEEDLHEKLPNLFILAAVDEMPLKTLEEQPDGVRKAIGRTRAYYKIASVVREFAHSVEGIDVPEGYEFLKILTRAYLNQFMELVEDAVEGKEVPTLGVITVAGEGAEKSSSIPSYLNPAIPEAVCR